MRHLMRNANEDVLFIDCYLFCTHPLGLGGPIGREGGGISRLFKSNLSYSMIYNTKTNIKITHNKLHYYLIIHRGMVQAWVGHFVTPLKRGYDKSNWWVPSQKPHKKHNYLINTTTMVVKLPTPPAAWIWWIHPDPGAGGLTHTFFEAAAKRF